jgi:hypothetical protein
MPPFAKINLMQAARLSHEGRFKEALAVLCGAAAAPSDLEGSASERAERPSSIIDMVPPAPGGCPRAYGADEAGPLLPWPRQAG